jgi:hypothetical protein
LFLPSECRRAKKLEDTDAHLRPMIPKRKVVDYAGPEQAFEGTPKIHDRRVLLRS